MKNLEKIYTIWNGERLSRHVAYWGFWLLLYATVGAWHNGRPLVDWLGVELLFMCVKLPFTYTVIYVFVPKFLLKRAYFPFVGWVSVGVIIGGSLIWSLYYFYLIDYFGHKRPASFWSFSLVYKSLDLLYISAIPAVFKLYQFFAQQEKQKQQVTEQKLHAELELLKHQLHPHFLFNTLNNLYGMILSGHPKAAEVVLHLSNLMSYMLYECNSPLIGLEKEIEQMKNYIQLEKIRYGNRLQVSFECGGDLQGKEIAPLLLMGFIENAFKHGVGSQIEESWIRINLWVRGSEMDFTVENSFSQEKGETTIEKKGIGLRNIQKRLELLYPERHFLKIEKNETYWVRLKLIL